MELAHLVDLGAPARLAASRAEEAAAAAPAARLPEQAEPDRGHHEDRRTKRDLYIIGI